MRYSKKVGVILTATALAGLSATAFVPQTAQAMHSMHSMKKKSDLSELDKIFLKDVNGGNLAEIVWKPVVMSHASSEAVKQFAQRMAQDHSKANKEAVALAARKGVRLPHQVADDEQAVIDRLKQEHGAAFDVAYQHEMVRDHIRDIGMFEREVSIGRDLAVKAYATKTLMVLKGHLKMAQNMMNGSAMNDGSMSGNGTAAPTVTPMTR